MAALGGTNRRQKKRSTQDRFGREIFRTLRAGDKVRAIVNIFELKKEIPD